MKLHLFQAGVSPWRAGAVMALRIYVVLGLTSVVGRRFPGFLYPTSILLRSPLNSLDRLAGLDVPVLQLHDLEDSVVPIEHARTLQKTLIQGTFVETHGLSHGRSLLHQSPMAYTAWRRWMEERVPRTGAATDE